MARYTGPKCKLCRREGVQLFLKGARCESPKCAITKQLQAPGQHGTSRRPLSAYGQQLREKQKTKRIYGVLERQFRKYYAHAQQLDGESGELLLQQLERRLDNVLYRIGLAHSRSHARQLTRQGKVSLNGSVVTIPSIQVSVGDVVSSAHPRVRDEKEPTWLSWEQKKASASVIGLPARDDITEPVEEQLIVEYYAR